MMKHTISPFCAVVLASFSATAFAAPPAQDKDAIVVTATRLPDAAPALVIDEATLERRAATFLVDQIATLPGVTVTQNGPFGGVATIRIRGAASEQTLVLIDGVAVNDPSAPGGGFNAAFLDAADVARVEVLRGPQSALWGSDAIGGVVNIVTRRPGPGLSARASVEGGSFATGRMALSGAFGAEAFDVRLGGVALRTDGISKADARDGNRETDPYSSETLDGRVGLDVTPELRLEAFARHSDSETDFDGFGFATGVVDAPEVSFTTERSGGAAARLKLLDGRLDTTLTLTRADIDRRSETAGQPGFGAEGFREAVRHQSTLRLAPQATLAFGAEREETKIVGAGSARIDGLFLVGDVQPLAGLALSAGVRRDDHSAFGDVTTGRLAARWTTQSGFGARASWGQGFKAPSLFQLSFFFPPAPGPNTDLKPEEAEGWDAGLFASLNDGQLTADIGVFQLETVNQIDFFGGRYENLARVESEGVEAEARWAPSPRLTLAGHYAYTDAVNAMTGRRLIRVPRHAGFVELDWRAGAGLGFTATARFNGEETDPIRPANPRGLVGAWTRLDLAGRYQIAPGLDLFGRVENITDEAYQDVFGYGAPGRSAYFGVRARVE